MLIGMRPAGEEARKEIAVGERFAIGEADDDQVLGRNHVKHLVARAYGGDEIARAAGVELVAVDGELEDLDGLELRIGRRTIKPEAEAVGGIGFVADEELAKFLLGNEMGVASGSRAIDEIAEFGPLFCGERESAVDEGIAGVIAGPGRDVDVERVKDFVLHEILDAFVADAEFAFQDFTEGLIVDSGIMEALAGWVDKGDAERGLELVAIGVDIAEVGGEAAGVGKELLDGDGAAAIIAPFGEGVAGAFAECEKAVLFRDEGGDGEEALGAAVDFVRVRCGKAGGVALK